MTTRRIVTNLLAILIGLFSSTIKGQEVEPNEPVKTDSGFYNIIIAPIAGQAVVSTIEHPSYSTYGIAVRPRMNKYFEAVLNLEQYLLYKNDSELKDSKSYPIRDHFVTSFGIQGTLPLLDVLTINLEIKLKLSNTDEDNSAIMYGSGFEVEIIPRVHLMGQQNRALYNLNTINPVEGSVIKAYSYRSWHFGVGYAILK